MGERIKELRKFLHLTQKEFGERIGVKGNTIAQYESGRNNPVDSALALICREFNVNEEWLRTGEGEMFNPEPTDKLDALFNEFNCDDIDRNLIKEYLALNPEQRNVLKEYVRRVFEGGQAAEKENG